MKTIGILLMLLAGLAYADDTPVMVDLDDPTQAALVVQINTARAAKLAAAAQRMADQIDGLWVDSTLTASGVSVLPDLTDSTWVRIDVPLSAASGLALSFWASVVQEFVTDGGEIVGVGQLRTSSQAAGRGLARLTTVLQLGQ